MTPFLLVIRPKRAGFQMRRADVPAKWMMVRARGQRRFGLWPGRYRPFSTILGARVDQLRAEGKRLSTRACRRWDNPRVAISSVSESRRGNRALNEIGLVYAPPQIVAADVVVGGEHGKS